MVGQRHFLSKFGILFVGLLVGLATSVLSLSPAQAAPAGLGLSDSTNLTPGTLITATITDSSGSLCNQNLGVGEWSIFLEWSGPDGAATVVGHSVAQSAQSSSFVVGTGATYTGSFYVVWLKDALMLDPWTIDGTYSVRAGCSTPAGLGDIADGLATNQTGTYSLPVSTSYQPVTTNATEIPQGANFTVTMTDSSQRWCNFTTGSGYSMGLWLNAVDPTGTDFAIPADLADGGVAGVGSFTWNNVSASVTATVPIDTPPGVYTLRVSCIEAGPTFVASTYRAVFGNVTVTASGPGPTPPPTPPLPNTGLDERGATSTGGVAVVVGMILLALTILRARRRV